MFTEESLRNHAALVKAFTGVEHEAFWELVGQVQAQLPAQERQRLQREERQRAQGGGRVCQRPLAARVALVLSYLRLHVAQEVVGLLGGTDQTTVSRELPRLMPVLGAVLPCPEVWELVPEVSEVSEVSEAPLLNVLSLEAIANDEVLVDATEQTMWRPQEAQQRQRFYSGNFYSGNFYSGKKKACTFKTQVVTDSACFIHAISAAPLALGCRVRCTTRNSAMRCAAWNACRMGVGSWRSAASKSRLARFSRAGRVAG